MPAGRGPRFTARPTGTDMNDANLPVASPRPSLVTTLDQLAAIPEEDGVAGEAEEAAGRRSRPIISGHRWLTLRWRDQSAW